MIGSNRQNGMIKRAMGLLTCTAMIVATSGTATAQEATSTDFTKRLYVNGGVGITRVEPESPTDALTISDDSDSGGHLAIGYDLSRMFTVEGYIADLGAADVDFLGTPAGSVDYQVFGLSLLGYLVNSRSGFSLMDADTEGLFRREGLSLYGRAGIGHMENDSENVDYVRDYATHAAFGLGLEYGFRNGVALRTELMSMDTDAKYLNVGVLKRFGSVPVAVPAAVVPTVAVAQVAVEPELPKETPVVAPVVPPLVYFEFDRSEINSEDALKLDAFAEAMQENELEIMIDGHTDWIAPEQYNMSLSIRRAEAVYNHLASKGVAPERMTTMGYGETRPISNNNTANGRALNRRVEIQIR
ncbi:OmpA family protein [Granulosicoccus sp. 3-233]|uniref:OmpA family protein n=1 Tax=Granulosicoccus sp. 3-233 TaxID=3417969 RepID=UPI003D33E964